MYAVKKDDTVWCCTGTAPDAWSTWQQVPHLAGVSALVVVAEAGLNVLEVIEQHDAGRGVFLQPFV